MYDTCNNGIALAVYMLCIQVHQVILSGLPTIIVFFCFFTKIAFWK